MKVHRPLQFSSTYLPELRDEAVDEDRLAQLPDLRDVVQQAEDLQSGKFEIQSTLFEATSIILNFSGSLYMPPS